MQREEGQARVEEEGLEGRRHPPEEGPKFIHNSVFRMIFFGKVEDPVVEIPFLQKCSYIITIDICIVCVNFCLELCTYSVEFIGST